jgi:uncharacterized protein (TIGR03083 family)
MNDQEIVDDLAAVWESLDRLCAPLSEAAWAAPTDCPGWLVKDLIAHIAGTESMLLGRRPPDHRPPHAGHLPNAIAELNEVEVDYRRPWPPARVLEDFREITAARLAMLRAMGDEEFSRPTPSPIGRVPYRDFMRLRVFDCWVHEQDIRRALDLPVTMDGHIARQAVERMAAAMPYVIGKRVAPPDGTTAVFVVAAGAGGTFPIEMAAGRARPCPAAPDNPTVRLEMDTEAFICLTCGRGDPWPLVHADRIRIVGDETLGRQIIEQANVMI